jgi:hypothetical protein
MPLSTDRDLQARLLKETSDLYAKKQQLEDKIRNLDVLNNSLQATAAIRDIEAHKSQRSERHCVDANMVKIQVSILDLLTTRLIELAMEIGMRRSGACLRKHFGAQLDQYEPSLKVAPYLFLFTTRN